MKSLFAVVVVACAISGCGKSYDGRYPIDAMRMMSAGPRVTQMVSETFPLDSWFEIESREYFRVHAGGVTSTYRNAKIVKTDAGFDGVSDDPHGAGIFSWSFEKGAKGDVCSLTFTHDGIHYLKMISKGKLPG